MGKTVVIAILAMGFSGLVAEVFLLREFLIVFAGNEFSIGLILANWLVIEALGAWAFGRIAEKLQKKVETFAILNAFFFAFLLVALFLVRILKRLLGISVGEPVGLLPMYWASLLILAPVSSLHGALFPSCCQIYTAISGHDVPSTGKVYAYETIGTVIGGVVCTYLFVPYLHTFQVVFWIALLNLFICVVLLALHRKTTQQDGVLPIIMIILFFFWGFGELAGLADALHHFSIRIQWKGLNVVHYQNSPYGNFCVVENEGQYIFFQDGIPELITPVPDLPFVEEFVHLPLLIHPDPKRLLIVSGGAGGVIYEALKHPVVESIEYAELDPLLIELLHRFPTPLTESELNDERVTILHIDGRLYLKMTRNAYDVILVGLTEPSTLQTNRFFTREFFLLVQRKLKPGGILVVGLPGSLTYSTPELANLNSSIFHTLKSVFSYVRIIPGEGTNLFLASDSAAIFSANREQVIEELRQRNLKVERIIPWYIEQKLHPGWQDWFHRFIKGYSREVNQDFRPIGVFYSVSHWNALFAPYLRRPFGQLEKINLGVIALLCGGIFLLFRLRKRHSPQAEIVWAIATTGFAGMIFDLMLIFAFQAVYGYVFSWIGLLVASFMAGAACGALLISHTLERLQNSFRFFLKTELAIIGFAVVCPLVFDVTHISWEWASGFLHRELFLALSFAGGLLISVQFPLANRLLVQDSGNLVPTAGLLYASDLLGGWLGGILGAVVFLPILGLWGTGIVVVLLKLTSFALLVGKVRLR